MIRESATLLHPANPVPVIVNVTVPSVLSFDPGVYSGFLILVFENVPSPDVVQAITEQFVATALPIDTFKSAQIVVSTEALTTGSGIVPIEMSFVAFFSQPRLSFAQKVYVSLVTRFEKLLSDW